MKLIQSTLNYYNQNADSLFERYEKANLKELQKYMLKFISKNDYILELGFGSGREINFLLKNGFKNIYGIDGCEKFVKNARERFNNNNFYFSILPNIDLPEKLQFDFIYSIAVWMHLPTEVYEKTINNIASFLKEKGKVLLSFSLDERKEKERYFQKVDEILLDVLFNKNNMKKLDEISTIDSLNRKIQWKSVIYGKN